MNNHEIKTLDNGLKLVTIKNDNLNSVVVRVGVKVGSRNEPNDVHGVSHFIEHMLFKGTTKRPTNKEISGLIDYYGGEHNAFTDKESTGFYIKIAKPYAATAIDIIYDLIKNPLLRTSDINKERSVIRDELSMYENSPDHSLWHLSEQLLYANSSLEHPIGGTQESVSFSASKLRNFFSQHYVPSRMVVALSGAVNDKLVNLTERKFRTLSGDFTGMEIPEIDNGITQQFGMRKCKVSNTDKIHILINLPGAPKYTKDNKVLNMIAHILGGNSSSRLFQSLREKQGLCYFVSAWQHSYIDTGSLCINTTVELDKAQQTITSILKELRKIRNKGFTDDEIKAAKANIRGSQLLSLDSPMAHGARAIDQLLFTNKLVPFEKDVKEYISINKKELNRICNEYLNFDNDNRINISVACADAHKDTIESMITSI